MSKAEPTLEEINSPTREIDYLEESNNVIDIISDILEEIVKENEDSCLWNKTAQNGYRKRKP